MMEKFHAALLQLAQHATLPTAPPTAKGPPGAALPVEVQPGDFADELRLTPDGPAPPRRP